MVDCTEDSGCLWSWCLEVSSLPFLSTLLVASRPKGCSNCLLFSYTNLTRVWYYRLLGAKVGKGVRLDGAQLGEWDLIEIGDNAALGRCICRPFAAEHNTTMYLGRITIGRNASIGLSSVVAPGTQVPEDTCIGPNSSSWELDDASESNRDLSSNRIPKPHWGLQVFGTLPLLALTRAIHSVPWLLGLLGLVSTKPDNSATPLLSIIHWFAGHKRVLWHLLALCLNTIFGLFFLLAAVLAIKATLDSLYRRLGPSKTSERGNLERWRMSLMNTIFPGSSLQSLTSLFGQHYEATSVILRLLGATVGKRVYWPGTGPGIGDYHLVNVGNDVVFGSRAHLVTSDGIGSGIITIKDGAMVADRVTCLPSVVIGENTILGSGALAKRNGNYADRGVFVGSRGGDAVCLSSGGVNSSASSSLTWRSGSDTRSEDTGRLSWDSMSTAHQHPESRSESDAANLKSSEGATNANTELALSRDREKATPIQKYQVPSTTNSPPTSNSTITPFGRAFYLNQAPYHVLGQTTILLYNVLIHVFAVIYWNLPFVLSVQMFDRVYRPIVGSLSTPGHRKFAVDADPLALFGLFTTSFALFVTLQSILALAIVILAKWALLGRRKPGTYSWDQSSYCQRWQAFLSIELLRRNCFRGNGILGMLTGTHWIVLYFRALGATIGKDCALFANGRPSLMFTEPDLLTLGDRVAVDDASLVGHVNTKGKFDLSCLKVGDRCVLRTGSRLLSGAEMREDSCLLEHTMVMGGEIVERGVRMQGWPAEVFKGERVRGVKRE